MTNDHPAHDPASSEGPSPVALAPAETVGGVTVATLERDATEAEKPAEPQKPADVEKPAQRHTAKALFPAPERAAKPTRSNRPESPRHALAATALTLISFLLLGLCVQLGLLSHVSFARTQDIAYGHLRAELARGTAPVGPTYVPEEQQDPQSQPEPQQPAGAGESEAPSLQVLHEAGTPVALLSIPAIGVHDLVVLEDSTAAVTQGGLGHDRRTAMPGQVGWSQVLGRRWSYGMPFRDLPSLRKGDDILVTTGQGEHRYEVTGLRRTGERVPVRGADEGRLVLVTAEGRPFMPDAPLYVDAVLKTQAHPANPPVQIPVDPASAPMRGDTSVWFTVLLWAQGLALAAWAVTWAAARWGRRQAWLCGVPVLTALSIGLASAAVQILPNVM